MEQQWHPHQPESTANDRTYLLRIWRTDVNQAWRISLRRADGSQVQYFPSLTAMVATLWQQLPRNEEDAW